MFSRLISGFFGTLGAVSVMQFPAFFQQYLQRLGGHLEQAKLDLQRFVDAAKLQGLSLNDYIQRLLNNSDEAVQTTATAVQGIAGDVQNHQQAYTALETASLWQQPALFIRWLDSNISSDTYAIFEPSLPLSLSGFIYGLIGLILGVSLLSICSLTYRAIKNTYKRLRANRMMRA